MQPLVFSLHHKRGIWEERNTQLKLKTKVGRLISSVGLQEILLDFARGFNVMWSSLEGNEARAYGRERI